MIINYLAIIPARSGSKGIQNKNIKLINNKECFRYTLEPAIDSKIDKIFFSTDSINYLELYKKYYNKDKDVTFDYLRNQELSTDNSLPENYIDSCLEFLTEKGYIIKNFIILQPTSLFRTSEQINRVITFHKDNNYENIKSVSPIIQTPYYMIYEDNTQVINNKFRNRQEHKNIYIFNGVYYVYSVKKYHSNNTVFIKFIMKTIEGLDLDDNTDLKLIELIIQNQKLFIE
jgi:CMP-N,N'-diacetyllegionaminic acid synthase